MTVLCEFNLARRFEAERIALLSRNLVERGLPWSWTPQRVRKCIGHPDYVVVVARFQRQLTGFAIMNFLQHHAHLCLLGVEPEYQRMGIGRRLVAWLEKSARVAGLFTVILEVRTTNQAAVNFYRRLGYTDDRVFHRYYSPTESAIRMSHDLRVAR